jgi:hypothetical protein
MSQNQKFLKFLKLIFLECPRTLEFIFYKISLQQVPNFENYTKRTLRKKKSLNFSGNKLSIPTTITAEKIFVENGLNDQKYKLKFSLPKKKF